MYVCMLIVDTLYKCMKAHSVYIYYYVLRNMNATYFGYPNK